MINHKLIYNKLYNESKNKTFKELKKKLLNINNPIEEKIIRQIMKERYIQYISYKNNIINKTYTNNNNNNNINNKNYNNNKLPNDICELTDDDIELFPKMKSLNELDELDDIYTNFESVNLYDKKFETEIKRDKVNNSLMDRMNSNLDIKNIMKKKKTIDINFELPYENTLNDISNNKLYKPFINNNIISPNDFSNNRLYNKHK